jgi:hypothetical protein
MSKQDEIKKKVREIVKGYPDCHFNKDKCNQFEVCDECITEDLFQYLHSQGVVIKVEGELPELSKLGSWSWRWEGGYDMAQVDMTKAGYTKTIPLIPHKEG